jgi:hypothetical protein
MIPASRIQWGRDHLIAETDALDSPRPHRQSSFNGAATI